jgi:pimeloyl-ACP methyl ester carboxylesterase
LDLDGCRALFAAMLERLDATTGHLSMRFTYFIRKQAPVLLVVAGEDEIVPLRRSQALAAAFRPGQARLVVAPEVGHNTLDLSPVYLDSVRGFLASAGAD